MRDVKHAIYSGNLVVLSGVIGAGKTAAMAQLRDTPEKEDRVAVSISVSIEKNRVAIGTLVTAPFCDLSSDKNATIPKSGELRDRALRNLVRKRKKPVVLFVDDAHDLNRAQAPDRTGRGQWRKALRRACRSPQASQRVA
jgi:type II secretory pathway predicted ATPase ExeA